MIAVLKTDLRPALLAGRRIRETGAAYAMWYPCLILHPLFIESSGMN